MFKIGNYVAFQNDNFLFAVKIISIKGDTIEVEVSNGKDGPNIYRGKVGNLNGIQLNDDWLQTIGFKATKTNESEYCFKDFIITKNENIWKLQKNEFVSNIEYVHDLQNIIN